MKKLLYILIMAILMAQVGDAATYYVATNGSNANPGTLARPFATIQKAANVMSAGDVCKIRGGTYRELVKPVRSGTANKPITYMPYNGESVTISAADKVSGWSVHNNKIYKANMAWDMGEGLNQVFVNGAMVNRARWPNTGSDLLVPTLADIKITAGVPTINNVSRPSGHWVGGTVYGTFGAQWASQAAKITASTAAGKLTVTDKTRWWSNGDGRGYITGVFEELDAPREWFRKNNKLYLWAPGSVNPSTRLVEAKARKWCIDLTGKSHIKFNDIDLFAAAINISHTTREKLRRIHQCKAIV